MLKLPLPELQILYTKHLILKELLIKDVSLYIFSVCFLYRKQVAFEIYQKQDFKNALPLLESLEDRFINGIVSYRLGYCYDINSHFFTNAYTLFNNKKDLSPEELFYMGCIYAYGKGGIAKNNEKAIEYYELANYPKALVYLGCAYRDGTIGVIQNDETAVMYFEKALNCSDGKCHLAYMLEFGRGIAQNSNSSKELYISAAKNNDMYAISRCKHRGWI
jgi:TPR repeat protein